MDDYPKPSLPVNPVLSGSFRIPGLSRYLSILHADHLRFVTSGRAAIALALKHAKIKPNDKVLVPAYHCSSMVEPILWAKAQPIFFRINADASVNLSDVESKLDENVKLIIVTHYFGFPQNITKIRQFCDGNNILLLEDCAHAFFGEHKGKAIGSYGDYSIASIMKFFPVYDGGCLASNNPSVNNIGLKSAGVSFQVKSILNIFEYSFSYGKLLILKITFGWLFKIKDKAWKVIKSSNKGVIAKSIGPGASEGGYQFEDSWVNIKMSIPSRLIMLLTSGKNLTNKRRRNYQHLNKGLGDLNGVKPLHENLPDNVIPYVYPLLFDEPEKIFPVLKKKGIPIIRFGEFLWEGVDSTVCSSSVDLSKRLFQFPCHHELSIKDLDWIVREVRLALS